MSSSRRTRASRAWATVRHVLNLSSLVRRFSRTSIASGVVRAAEERARGPEAEREAEARRTIAVERARIAHELHDVVAHNVSVMTVQAAGVRRLLREDQEREREALLTIEQTGRQALAEMRRLLALLREPTEQADLAPQPGLSRLDTLIAEVRDAGLPVELHVDGDPVEPAAGIGLCAYRVIQEALGNALESPDAARAAVHVVYGEDMLEVAVANDGGMGRNGDGSGPGLVGMRERVALCGGKLESGRRAEGGYEVRAVLPLRATS